MELGAIAEQHPNERVDVYFCALPGLARTIRNDCAALALGSRQEQV